MLGLAGVTALLIAGALAWSGWWRPEPSPASAPTSLSGAQPKAAAQPTSNHVDTLTDIKPAPTQPALEPQVAAANLKSEAVDVARQVADAFPQDALAYALLGSAYYNTGRSEEAARHLRRCLELNPGQADAYDILARVAYEKGNLDEAVQLCRDALKRAPANPEVLNRLGRALMDLGRTDEAVQTLEQAVRLAKPTSESCYLLGQAFLQGGNYAEAKKSFQQAIALLPDHTQACFGLYTASMRLGQTDEAEKFRAQFQRLEAIDRQTLTDRSAQEDTLTGLPLVRSTVARTLFGAGQIYRVHKETGKAAELFRRSAALDADNPVYRAAMEALYVQRNALAEGVTAFEQLAAQQPDSGLNYFFLGRLHGRLNHFEAAEHAFQKVQGLDPGWAEGYRALAELYLGADRKPGEARKLAGRLIELEPSGGNYYLLALACLKNDDRAGALEAAKQAVARGPANAKQQQLLEQLNKAP